MKRREFLKSLPLATGVGALGYSSGALAADPGYYTKNGDDAVVVSGAQSSPGADWAQQTLQGAINLAIAAGKPLKLLKGTFLTSGLVITGAVEISASAGQALILPAGANCFNLDIRPPAGAQSLAGVAIRGVSFWGANKGFSTGADQSARIVDPSINALGTFNALLTAYRVIDLVIENCSFGGSLSGAVALWQCQNALFQDNEIFLNSIALYANNNWQCVFASNYVHDNSNIGIFINQWPANDDSSVIRGNRIVNTNARSGASGGQVAGSGQYGNGILAFYAHNLNITHNRSSGSAFSGIRINGGFACVIADNQVLGAGGTGIMVECPGGTAGTANPLRYEGGVISNNVVNDSGRGIAVTNGYRGGRRVVVSGNHVKTVLDRTINTTDPNFPTFKTTGVGILAEADVVVSGNIVEDAQGPGILGTPGVIAGSTIRTTFNCTGNTVKNAPIGVAFLKESALGYSLIESNMLVNCSSATIASVYNTCGASCTYPRTDSIDYGRLQGGLYSGKPYPNVMIALNFAT